MAGKKEQQSSSSPTSAAASAANAVNGNASPGNHNAHGRDSPPDGRGQGQQGPGGSGVMAAEYFAVGSVVRCMTCKGTVTEGVVTAFDPSTRMLILKTPSNKRGSLNDLHFVNLALASDVNVVSEAANGIEAVQDPPSLNVSRLTTRLHNNVDRRKLNVKAFKGGVSPDGQRLFQVISKT